MCLRSVRGGCVPCPTQPPACPPRAPWDEAPAEPPKPENQHDEGSDGKVQGDKGGECHGIRRMSWDIAGREDRGFPVKGYLRKEPGIA